MGSAFCPSPDQIHCLLNTDIWVVSDLGWGSLLPGALALYYAIRGPMNSWFVCFICLQNSPCSFQLPVLAPGISHDRKKNKHGKLQEFSKIQVIDDYFSVFETALFPSGLLNKLYHLFLKCWLKTKN